MLAKLLSASSGGAVTSDDVFSAYTYTGNGATQAINNGIDLAGKGGLVWIKDMGQQSNHILSDSTGIGLFKGYLSSNNNGAPLGSAIVYPATAGNTGFRVTSDGNMLNQLYISWTFRRAQKFFDMVTYTGDGVAGRTIAHSLGVTPGMIIIKPYNSGSWMVWNNSFTSGQNLNLYSTSGGLYAAGLFSPLPTSTTITLGQGYGVNSDGVSYVAYLFAHDPSADGIIQCGSFTGPSTISLGWEPQYVLYRRIPAIGEWGILDVSREWSVNGFRQLFADKPFAEQTQTLTNGIHPTSTGFTVGNWLPADAYIYMAIRRPNKPPTLGTEVYSSSSAGGVIDVGFPVDLHIGATRAGASNNHCVHTRLIGGTKELVTSSSLTESAITDVGFDSMRGLKTSFGSGQVNHLFRRAARVYDQICYTGSGSNKTEAISLLGAPAELWLVKGRSVATQWVWGSSYLAATQKIVMPPVIGKATDTTVWNSAYPTATTFSLGTSGDVNTASAEYVAYFWATLAGVSKVGIYTGNGTTQNLDMGFATGARFFMVLRTTASTTQDIYIWDSVRGITAGNDPHLSLNNTAAEVTTDDSVDPYNLGITVNQVAATKINVNGAVYLYLAYA